MTRLFFKGAVPPPEQFKTYRKKTLTKATRIDGPFAVETLEGTMTCPDGFLAIDSYGNPYPIAKQEFENIYEEVNGHE